MKLLKSMAAMAAMLAFSQPSSADYDISMRRKPAGSPGPSKEKKAARKRQKQARKQNRR